MESLRTLHKILRSNESARCPLPSVREGYESAKDKRHSPPQIIYNAKIRQRCTQMRTEREKAL